MITSRRTPELPLLMIVTSPIMKLHNISATSPITPRLGAICAASAISSPTWLRAGYRGRVAFFTFAVASPISPNKCLSFTREHRPPRPTRSLRRSVETTIIQATATVRSAKRWPRVQSMRSPKIPRFGIGVWSSSLMMNRMGSTIMCRRAFCLMGRMACRSRGIRVPLIVISPYARVHAVSHVEGDHNAVIETINAIFGLPALASLPDEAEALTAGRADAFNGPNGFVQNYLGPRDINSSITDDLLSAFDPKRLLGLAPRLPGSYASIAEEAVNSLPHYGGRGCAALGITTEDRRQGVENAIPTGFNPLPATYPAAN
jgi:Phosphoesterase family